MLDTIRERHSASAAVAKEMVEAIFQEFDIQLLMKIVETKQKPFAC